MSDSRPSANPSPDLEPARTEEELRAMMASDAALVGPEAVAADLHGFAEYHKSVAREKYPRRRIPASFWLLALLIPYAAAATWAWMYLLQLRLNQQPQMHVLESIPDQGLYEDFLDGRRREVIPLLTKAGEKPVSNNVIPPTEPLSNAIPPVAIGMTRHIGALAITPLEVSHQRLHYDYKSGQRQVDVGEGLVLKLQVKNEGALIFRPEDETFNRAYLDDSRVPIYTFLEIGKDRFYGAVADPTTERLSLPRCSSLLPDETGVMYITAFRGSDGKTSVTTALRNSPDQLLWRVHIRRGKEDVALSNGRHRQVWVTAVVPVQFQVSEIKNTERNP